jgi:uncharacterized membrane protein HdeD (DUF308 family)
MANERDAFAEFKRMIGWIALIGVLMVVAALWYLSLYEPLRLHMVIATIAGVFFSVLLGCGLFAAAFYSDKSGYDQNVTDATKSQRDKSDAQD